MHDTGKVILSAESEMQGKHKLTSKYTVQHRKKIVYMPIFLRYKQETLRYPLSQERGITAILILSLH
jgi:hypothetical protein